MKNEIMYSSLEATVIKFKSSINELKSNAEKGWIKESEEMWNYRKSNYHEQFNLWINNIIDYMDLEETEEDKQQFQSLINRLNKLSEVLDKDIDKNVIIYKIDHEF